MPTLAEVDYERVERLADLGGVRAELAEALRGLSQQQREALRLRVIEERPYREVAQRLGISEQTARARVSPGVASAG
ncbi:MAG: RNA polymerase sigma factor [Solirubrobacteraceae bacterium]